MTISDKYITEQNNINENNDINDINDIYYYIIGSYIYDTYKNNGGKIQSRDIEMTKYFIGYYFCGGINKI